MRYQLAQLVILLVMSWIVMTLTHESGHVIAGWLGGATLTDFDVAPWRLPYSLHNPNPHPLLTLWGGPIFGVLIPFVAACIIRRSSCWFVANFCLLANGVYLSAAWLSGDRYLDTAQLLDSGASPGTIGIYCILAVSIGYRQFRSSCIAILAPKQQAITSHRSKK